MDVFYIFLAFIVSTVVSLDSKDCVIIILSQENEYHDILAENLRNEIIGQLGEQHKGRLQVHLSHKDFPHVGGWTILPLIASIANLYKENKSWIIFLEDRTKVNLKLLLETLEKYNPAEDVWLGHALHDNEPTIIHHFAFLANPKEFIYPNIASGIALSSALLNRIDNAHELALFIWNKGLGQVLQHEPSFCLSEEPNCATFPAPFQQCGAPVPKSSIYFAVKTCQKFHSSRIPIVQQTWAQHAENIKYFSDMEDISIPTISLGVPNTEQGHCEKTMAILKFVEFELNNLPEVNWIVVTDDDTILGVSKLQQLLSCYNSSIPVALGERYGYNVHNSRGYNYITGGGGMVFSSVLLRKLVNPGTCACPSSDVPDDMYLGICIANLDVPITHSPLFHQARPDDYALGYLNSSGAVSFHKHWMIDPVSVYKKWFAEDDLTFDKTHNLHQEL